MNTWISCSHLKGGFIGFAGRAITLRVFIFYTYFHNLFGLSEVAMISRSKSRMRTSRALFMLTIPLC